MPRKDNVVDGYTVIAAARRAAGPGKDRPPKPAEEKPEAPKEGPPTDHKSGVRIGRTVLPSKQLITCYECGFEFQLIGRAQATMCPKCRVSLDLVDYTIDSEWTETLKTAGTVTLTPAARLKGAELFAQHVILQGKIGVQGAVHAYGQLTIHDGCEFTEDRVDFRDLKIEPDANVAFKKKKTCGSVDIHGTFKGRLEASGVVTVRAGAFLQGDVTGRHLVVEEGGGLCGKMKIEESKREATGEKRAHGPEASRDGTPLEISA